MEKHIITLKNISDSEVFYNDMEKSGYVNRHIPERSIECHHRLEYTSNVIYFITREEAVEIKKDPRVWDVIAESDIPPAICPAIYTSGAKIGYTTGKKEFYRGTKISGKDQYNMALLRYSGEQSGKRWGSNQSADQVDSGVISQNWTGQNIDMVTIEGGAPPAVGDVVNINHPEFKNRFTGLTRVKKLDWSLYGASNSPFNYSAITDDGLLTNHAAGTLSTFGGLRGGFAKDANLYCAYFASTGIWSAIINWHNQKSVNPDTGYKNPTIITIEYYIVKPYLMKVSDIEEIQYRGDTYSKPSPAGWTIDQLESFKICPYYIDVYNSGSIFKDEPVIAFGNGVATGSDSDTFAHQLAYVKDAVDAGIHVFSPLGNQGYPMAYNGQEDYNNKIKPKSGATIYQTDGISTGAVSIAGSFASNFSFYYMRPYGPSGSENGINVAALFPSVENYLEPYTSKGPCTHICSPGSGQFSAFPTGSYVPGDSTNQYGYFSGTSAATPLASGIAACYLEYDIVSKNSKLSKSSWGTNLQTVYPLYTPVELRDLLITKAETDKINDTTTPPRISPTIAGSIPDIGNSYHPSTTLFPDILNGCNINFRTMGTPDRIIRFPKEDREATIPSGTRTTSSLILTSEELAVSRAVEAALPAGTETASLVRIGEELRTRPVGFGGRNNGGNAKNTRGQIDGRFQYAHAGGGGGGWRGGGGGNFGGGGGGGAGFARDVSGTSVRTGKADTGGNSDHGFIRLFLNETGSGERPSIDVDPIGPNV